MDDLVMKTGVAPFYVQSPGSPAGYATAGGLARVFGATRRE